MPKILVLDDREDYLRALRGALRSEFEVVATKTVEEAQQALDETVQVALVDVRLSEEDETNRDGVVFLQWAKERFPRTPVLMMSAYRDFDAVVEAVNVGANYYLKKPIDLRELKSLLREFAEHGTMPEKTAELKRRMERER
jgi:DNA-binding NtrC family response regulator